AYVQNQTAVAQVASYNINGSATAGSLAVGGAASAGSLGVTGLATAGSLNVAGAATAGSLKLNGGTVFNRTEGGTLSIGPNAVGNVLTVSLTFPTAFVATPHLIVTPNSASAGETYSIAVGAISTTGATVYIRRQDVTGGTW